MKISNEIISIDITVPEVKELIVANQWDSFLNGIKLTARQQRKVDRIANDKYKPSKTSNTTTKPKVEKAKSIEESFKAVVKAEKAVAEPHDFWYDIKAKYNKISFSSEEIRTAVYEALHKLPRPIVTQADAEKHFADLGLLAKSVKDAAAYKPYADLISTFYGSQQIWAKERVDQLLAFNAKKRAEGKLKRVKSFEDIKALVTKHIKNKQAIADGAKKVSQEAVEQFKKDNPKTTKADLEIRRDIAQQDMFKESKAE